MLTKVRKHNGKRLECRKSQRVKVFETPDPKGKAAGELIWKRELALLLCPPGVEQAATGCVHFSVRNEGTLIPLYSSRDASMPACGREDGGSVVAESPAVMARTG